MYKNIKNSWLKIGFTIVDAIFFYRWGYTMAGKVSIEEEHARITARYEICRLDTLKVLIRSSWACYCIVARSFSKLSDIDLRSCQYYKRLLITNHDLVEQDVMSISRTCALYSQHTTAEHLYLLVGQLSCSCYNVTKSHLFSRKIFFSHLEPDLPTEVCFLEIIGKSWNKLLSKILPAIRSHKENFRMSLISIYNTVFVYSLTHECSVHYRLNCSSTYRDIKLQVRFKSVT